MRERNRQVPQRKSRNKFLFIIGIAVIMGLLWVKSAGDNPSYVVPGKIFEVQSAGGVGPANHMSIGYIAFGSRQDNFGCLYILASRKDEEKMNDSGELSEKLHVAGVWTNRDNGSIIECPYGLQLAQAMDDPDAFYPELSMSVYKVSGIFKKTLEVKRKFTSFLQPDKESSDNVKLVEVGTIKENKK